VLNPDAMAEPAADWNILAIEAGDESDLSAPSSAASNSEGRRR
jgi:hypothetical protein